MDNELFFKALSIIGPFVSGFVTYRLTQRSKRTEYLYQYRIPAFIEVFKVVATIKRYAEGQVAMALGNEFAPVFDEPGSPLSLRISLFESRETNDIFLTSKSREALDELNTTLDILSSAYLNQKNADGTDSYDIDYRPLLELVSNTQRIMYDEINLPKN